MSIFRKRNDHLIATVARVVVGAGAAIFGLFMLRSLPDFIRYVKLERM